MNDELEIRRLIEDYSDAVNQRDADLIESLWDADGRWSVPEVESLADIRGATNIRRVWEGMMSMVPVAFLVCVPAAIRIDGDMATARSYGTELVTDPEGVTRYGVGYYRDRFVRCVDGWRFAERVWCLISRKRVLDEA